MKRPTSDKTAAAVEKHVALLERLSEEMWRNGLAEAAVAVVQADGALTLETLIAELRRMGETKPRVKLNEHTSITIETRTSETAIEHLAKALAAHGDSKSE